VVVGTKGLVQNILIPVIEVLIAFLAIVMLFAILLVPPHLRDGVEGCITVLIGALDCLERLQFGRHGVWWRKSRREER
jgi:hypothetical protein